MSSDKNIFHQLPVNLIAEFRPIFSDGGYDLGMITELSDEGFIIETQNYLDLAEGNILEINLKDQNSDKEIAVLGQVVSREITWYKNRVAFKYHETDQETKSSIEELASASMAKQASQFDKKTGTIDDQVLKALDIPIDKTPAGNTSPGDMPLEESTSDQNEEVGSTLDDTVFKPRAPVKNETENVIETEPVELNVDALSDERLRYEESHVKRDELQDKIEEAIEKKKPVGVSHTTNFKLQDKKERSLKGKSAFQIKIVAVIVFLAITLFLISNSIKQDEELATQNLVTSIVQQDDGGIQSQLNDVDPPSNEVIPRAPLKTETLREDIKGSDPVPLEETAAVQESNDNTQAETKYEDAPPGKIMAEALPKPEPLPEGMGAGGALLEQEKTQVSTLLPAKPDIEQKTWYAVSVYILNIRENPSTESSIVGKMKRGTVFDSAGYEENSDGRWLKMDRGYVFGLYTIELQERINLSSSDLIEKEEQKYTVNANVLNIRSRPTVTSGVVGKLKKGEAFVVNGKEYRADGLWLKMDKGYVSAVYARDMAERLNVRIKGKYTVYVQSLNIRSRPTVTSGVVGKLKRGEVFVVNGKEYRADGLWLRTDRGYVFAAYAVELHQDQ